MRLLHAQSLNLLEFEGSALPPYACLSHTWETEEVTYTAFQKSETRHQLKGWEKIRRCCQQAVTDGIEYVWIDTCCIDKSSSAELSEAVNSMFTCYWDSQICYAYLCDVEEGSSFAATQQIRTSRWWSRGWTLQELLAPLNLVFFDQYWRPRGSRQDYQELITEVTAIDREDWELLRSAHHYNERSLVKKMSVARKMSWAAHRQTTRPEDLAYCLMGLFDVNMPLLYGEGSVRFSFHSFEAQLNG